MWMISRPAIGRRRPAAWSAKFYRCWPLLGAFQGSGDWWPLPRAFRPWAGRPNSGPVRALSTHRDQPAFPGPGFWAGQADIALHFPCCLPV